MLWDARLSRLIRFLIVLDACVVAVMMIGGFWDAAYHKTKGHWLYAPPHLVILASFVLAFFVGLTGVLFMISAGASEIRLSSERDLLWFCKLIRCRFGSPEGRCLWLIMAGPAVCFLALYPFDEWWHEVVLKGDLTADQSVWSPPHFLMWLGMTTQMFSLLVLARKQDTFRAIVRMPAELMPATLFFSMLFFQFIEYDITSPTRLVDGRPGWIYPVVSAFFFGGGLSLVLATTGSMRLTVAAACIAWCFNTATAFLVQYLTDTWFIAPPFPFVAYALLSFCAASKFDEKQIRDMVPTYWFSFASITLLYGSIVLFAPLTNIPHRVYGEWHGYILGFVVCIMLAFTACLLTRRFFVNG